MQQHSPEEDPENFIAELKAKQRNTLWPDAFRNSSAVDKLLWRGSPDAPPVQRIGMVLFGLMWLGIGTAFLLLGLEDESSGSRFAEVLMAMLLYLLGLRFFFNAFKRRKQ